MKNTRPGPLNGCARGVSETAQPKSRRRAPVPVLSWVVSRAGPPDEDTTRPNSSSRVEKAAAFSTLLELFGLVVSSSGGPALETTHESTGTGARLRDFGWAVSETPLAHPFSGPGRVFFTRFVPESSPPYLPASFHVSPDAPLTHLWRISGVSLTYLVRISPHTQCFVRV